MIKHMNEIEPQELLNGEVLKRVFISKDEAPTFVMRLFTLQSNASTPLHSHPWEHEVFVVEGRLKVVCDNGETIVEKGHFVYVSPNELHQFVNVFEGPSSFICVVPKEGEV
ncbi:MULTISPECIES: cupin domain-containing protein [Pseudothermotoga]|nr:MULTISPECIES: cupin domain-containing protein [Pseudothermotoga]MBC7123967.1 cupin domain-containing protein [Pseudothermotoga sp.]MDI6863082.1 cupin domain-containing protein [Pseudothermotoga sp.]